MDPGGYYFHCNYYPTLHLEEEVKVGGNTGADVWNAGNRQNTPATMCLADEALYIFKRTGKIGLSSEQIHNQTYKAA
ncbi:hypothetical protein [Paenibacillus sp. NPDC057934]|uniref:hypothetical protein n=1 Tax=Paenibacillus sp. NPDC057934 TaxID=3346282 RepID=UPI0036D8F98E